MATTRDSPSAEGFPSPERRFGIHQFVGSDHHRRDEGSLISGRRDRRILGTLWIAAARGRRDLFRQRDTQQLKGHLRTCFPLLVGFELRSRRFPRRLRSSIPNSPDCAVRFSVQDQDWFPGVPPSSTPRAGDPTGVPRVNYGLNRIGNLRGRHYGRQIETYKEQIETNRA